MGIKKCQAPNCTNSMATVPKIRVRNLPADRDRAIRWMKNAGRHDLLERFPDRFPQTIVFCDDHFEDHCFNVPSSRVTSTLTRMAVPTLFDGVDPSCLVEAMYEETPPEPRALDVVDPAEEVLELARAEEEKQKNIQKTLDYIKQSKVRMKEARAEERKERARDGLSPCDPDRKDKSNEPAVLKAKLERARARIEVLKTREANEKKRKAKAKKAVEMKLEGIFASLVTDLSPAKLGSLKHEVLNTLATIL